MSETGWSLPQKTGLLFHNLRVLCVGVCMIASVHIICMCVCMCVCVAGILCPIWDINKYGL